MKYEFDKRGNNFVDIKKIDDKVVIVISAEKSATQTTVNSSKLTIEQFRKIVEEIFPPQEFVLNADQENVENAG
jgi:hypothetical protein